jgi:hypothetical protein
MAEQAVATEEVKTSNNSEYQMDLDPFVVKINVFPNADKKHEVTHVVRKPTFAEEEARERMMPLIISDAGKVDGAEASSMSLDDEPANVRLYDKIALTVSGYALQKGQKPTEDMVSVEDKVSTTDGEEKSIKDLIPPSHKSAVINGLFPSSYEVDFGGEEYYFALGGGREWKIRQEIGGKFKREDGTLSPLTMKFFIFSVSRLRKRERNLEHKLLVRLP